MTAAESPASRLRFVLLLVATAALAACSHEPQRSGPPGTGPGTTRVPAQEPPSARGNPESYEVFGQRYYTLASNTGYRERGVASWYGRKFHGRETSSGEIYDMHALTAAHKSLPLPTWAEVTNLRNGKRVIVRINDRGPFVKNRLIDLSYAAATQLDLITDGTGLVEVRALTSEDPGDGALVVAAPATRATTAPARVATAGPAAGVVAGNPAINVANNAANEAEIVVETVTRAAPVSVVAPAQALEPDRLARRSEETVATATAATVLVAAAASPPPTTPEYRLAGHAATRAANGPDAHNTALELDTTLAAPAEQPAGEVSERNIYVQVGAFGAMENAHRMRDRLLSFGFDEVGVHSDHDAQIPIFRVRLGPVLDVADFDRLVDMMRGLDIHDTYLAVD